MKYGLWSLHSGASCKFLYGLSLSTIVRETSWAPRCLGRTNVTSDALRMPLSFRITGLAGPSGALYHYPKATGVPESFPDCE